MAPKVWNVLLRFFGLGGRYLLGLYFFKEYSAAEYSDYVLLISLLTFSVYLSGLELGVELNRRLRIGEEGLNPNSLMVNFLYQFACTLPVVVLLCWALSGFTDIPFIQIFSIVATEVVLSEYIRSLTSGGKPVLSSVILVLKGLAPIGGAMFIGLSPDSFIFCWAITNLILTVVVCFRVVLIAENRRLDYEYLSSSTRLGFRLFLPVNGFRSFLVLDKVVLSNILADERLAFYMLASSTLSICVVIYDAVFLAFKNRAFARDELSFAEFERAGVLLSVALVSSASFFVILFALTAQNYSFADLGVVIVLAFFMVFYMSSFVYHGANNHLKNDRRNIAINYLAIFTFALGCILSFFTSYELVFYLFYVLTGVVLCLKRPNLSFRNI